MGQWWNPVPTALERLDVLLRESEKVRRQLKKQQRAEELLMLDSAVEQLLKVRDLLRPRHTR